MNNNTLKLTPSEQSRINGAKSKGPITPEGKAISSGNAVKHGFASTFNIVLAVEDEPDFLEHLAQLRACYKPRDYVENSYIEQLASITWRQSRLVALETAFITAQMSLHDDRVCEEHPQSADNNYFHLVQAWRALASPPRPRTPEDQTDSTHPPNGYDILSMDLLRRYQTSLDRQHRNTLLNLNLYRKNFGSVSEPAPQPNEPEIVPKEEPKKDEPKPRAVPVPPPAPIEPELPITPVRPVVIINRR